MLLRQRGASARGVGGPRPGTHAPVRIVPTPRGRPAAGSLSPGQVDTAAGLTFFKRNLLIPQQLVGNQGAERRQQTVYTVRICTGASRGSGLDEPTAGVQLCLVGAEGAALMHRVPPVFDPEALQAELAAIREVVDGSLGMNRAAIDAAAERLAALPPGKPRFQPGSVDEVSFLGPEIGPVQSMLVAPEQGSWRLEEATVSSSRARRTDRFVCGELLGERRGAGFLAALPPDAVTYGSGESLAVLTRAQARELHEAGMGRYSLLKARLLRANAALVAAGACVAWLAGGPESAADFATGGGAGLTYQWLLQRGVDELGLTQSRLFHRARALVPGAQLRRLAASGSFRLAFVCGCLYLAALATGQSAAPPLHTQHSQVEQLLVGAAGFLCYKLALLGVLLVPPLLREDGHV